MLPDSQVAEDPAQVQVDRLPSTEKGVNYVMQLRRKPALVTVLVAVVILFACSRLVTAEPTEVVILSPTRADPAYVRPGSTVEIRGKVITDSLAPVALEMYFYGYLIFASATPEGPPPPNAHFSLEAPVPNSDGKYLVHVVARGSSGDPVHGYESDAIIVDTTAPTVEAVRPTAPSRTTDPTPTWQWRYWDSISALDHFVVTLDNELSIHTTSTWFTPSSALVDGTHRLKVQAVDRAGNASNVLTFPDVHVDTAPPPAPVIHPLAAGYNAPFAVAWDAVSDVPNEVGYELQHDDNATFVSASLTFMDESTSQECGALTSQGEHWFRVRAVSEVAPGETKFSDWSLPVHTVYDTTAPAQPILTRVTPSPTNTVPQMWSWSAPPDAAGYKVDVNNAGFVDVGGINIYHTEFDVDGVYPFAVLAYDWLSNESAAAAASVVVDRTPPSIPENLRLVGTSPMGDNTPGWMWDRPTDWVEENLRGYEVRLDGVAIIDVGLVEGFTHSEALGDGNHAVQVRSYDDLGNRSNWTSGVVVEVDTAAPAIPGMPTTASPTRNAAPTWTWTHVDPDDVAAYRVYVDGQFHTACTYQTFTHESSAHLGHGMHTLQVAAEDMAGNISERSAPGQVFVDLLPPGVPAMSPMPNYSRPGSIPFSWSASGDDLPVTYSFYWSMDGSIPWPSVTDLTVPAAIVDASSAAHGTMVQGRASAVDAVGNESADSETVFTVIDAEAPVVVDETPSSSEPTNDSTPAWTWSATDSGSGLAYFLVTLDGELPFRTPALPGVGTYSFTPASALIDGPHTLSIAGVDKVGNEGAALCLKMITVDTKPPAIPGMPRTASPTNNQSPIWTWGAVGGADEYGVYEDGDYVGNVPAMPSAGPEFQSSGLAEGLHVLEVTAIDAAGNESARSTAGHVLVDLTPPAVPKMTRLAPFTNADVLELSWTAVEGAVSYDLAVGGYTTATIPGMAVAAYDLNIRNGGGAPVPATVDGNTVTVAVRAYDLVGNPSGWSADVSTVIDRTGPTTTAAVTPPSTTNDTRPTWEWEGDDAGLSGVAYYVLTLDGEPPFSTTGKSFTPAHDLPAGGHILTVQGVDALGNTGNVFAFATVAIVEPVIISATPLPGAYAVNNLSTLALSITGMIDATLQVAAGDSVLEAWRIVELYRTPALAKFYVLLDAEVLQPGELWLTISAGMTRKTFIYEVLSERSGFGFGRLRPW